MSHFQYVKAFIRAMREARDAAAFIPTGDSWL